MPQENRIVAIGDYRRMAFSVRAAIAAAALMPPVPAGSRPPSAACCNGGYFRWPVLSSGTRERLVKPPRW